MGVARIRGKVTVTPDPDLTAWLDSKVDSRKFKDRTHAFEWCVGFLIDQEHRFGSLEEFEIFCREMRKYWKAGRIDEESYLAVMPDKKIVDSLRAEAKKESAPAERGRPAREKPKKT